MVAASGVEITRYEPRLLGPLADFYRAVWDPRATPESLAQARARHAAENLATPGEEIPTWLFLRDGRIIGHVTTVPIQLWEGRASRPAHWFNGLMVLPEHRNGPVGFLLMREAVKQLQVTLSLTVQRATVRLLTGVGFTELGVVPNYVRLLHPAGVIHRLDLGALGVGGLPRLARFGLTLRKVPGVSALGGLAVSGALGVWAGWHRLRTPGLGLRLEAPAAIDRLDLDTLWQGIREQIAFVGVRDGAYLSRRYRTGETQPYRVASVHQGEKLLGIAVVRAPRKQGDPRLQGIRIATLSDLVFDPRRTDVGLRLLAGVDRLGRLLGADALLTSVSHGSHGPLLRRRGYVRFGGNLHFLTRDSTGALPGSSRLRDWWVMRGDMNADSVF